MPGRSKPRKTVIWNPGSRGYNPRMRGRDFLAVGGPQVCRAAQQSARGRRLWENERKRVGRILDVSASIERRLRQVAEGLVFE